MLLQFSVTNFKTFKEKATISLIASNYDKKTRVNENIFIDKKNDFRVLKSAIIYGPNASGKSKFIEAFLFMKKFVTSSSKDSQKGDKIYVEPFMLNTETEKETCEFEVIFTFQNIIYRYGFETNENKIFSEWFYYKPKTKEIELFFRNHLKFRIHPRIFKKGTTLNKNGLIRDNALMLSVAAQFNEENSTKVLSWFQELNIVSDDRSFKNNSIAKVKDPIYKKKILKLLKGADIDIDDLDYKEIMDFSDEKLKKAVTELKEAMHVIDSEAFSDIATFHKKFDSKRKLVDKVKFSMYADESKGTQKYFYLTGLIIDALERGGIIIADELDTKIHPNLVCKIISLFNSKIDNPKNAQLIFNTHDTNLLSSQLFRRDQIWFIEKSKYGEAKLYSLADFKSENVRKNEAFEENYIRGKYGAIPFLGLFNFLDN